MKSRGGAKDPSRIKISLIAVSLVSALGIQFLSAAALPILLGSIADRITLSPSQIGLLGTSELASIAIAAFAVSPVVGRRSRVALAAAGCASAAVGNFMTAHAYTFTLLSISRAVAG